MLGLYLAVWTPLTALQVVLLASRPDISWPEATLVGMPLGLVYGFVCLSSWYICRSLPLGESNLFRILATFAVASLLSSSYWLLIGRLWSGLLSRVPTLEGLGERYSAQVPLLFIVGLLLFLLSVAAHYLIISFDDSRVAEREAFEMKLLARDAEMKALRFQINPHFLFNSLNSVSALTTSDPQGARRMCLLLAGFLRSSLRFGAHEKISLKEEMGLVRDYLEIEKVRRSASLETEIEIDEAAQRILAPPLILQPLVENGVKHGISHLIGGGTISIRATLSGDRLQIRVENPYDPDALGSGLPGTGLGLKNVEKRLESVYPKEWQMKVSGEDGIFRVDLSFPAEREGEEA